MNINKAIMYSVSLALILGSATAVLGRARHAKAQTTYPVTWVSGAAQGNPTCTRLDPCYYFDTALNSTVPGGEIQVLDAGNYQWIDITQAVTIEGDSANAGIFPVQGNAYNAIYVNAGPTDVVVLRHLILGGGGQSVGGIYAEHCGELVLDDCKINGFGQEDLKILAGVSRVTIENCDIDGGTIAVDDQGGATVSIRNTNITGAVRAISASSGKVSVSNSMISQNTQFGICALSSAVVSTDNCMISHNATGVIAENSATVRLSNDDLFDNKVGLSYSGAAVISSTKNNRNAGNGSTMLPNGTISTF